MVTSVFSVWQWASGPYLALRFFCRNREEEKAKNEPAEKAKNEPAEKAEKAKNEEAALIATVNLFDLGVSFRVIAFVQIIYWFGLGC